MVLQSINHIAIILPYILSTEPLFFISLARPKNYSPWHSNTHKTNPPLSPTESNE